MKKIMICAVLFLLAIILIGKFIVVYSDINNDGNNENFEFVSAPMTYEEMVSYYAQVTDCPYEEAISRFPKTNESETYRILSVGLDVTPQYKPKINFYCETIEAAQSWGISSICYVQLDRRCVINTAFNSTITKQFNGIIEIWLRDEQTIEYIINGDFYNNGETSVKGNFGSKIELNESEKIAYSVSFTETTNYYSYCYKTERRCFR